VHALDNYWQMNSKSNHVFEDQFAGEPYNARSAQEVMRLAVKKTGLKKKLGFTACNIALQAGRHVCHSFVGGWH